MRLRWQRRIRKRLRRIRGEQQTLAQAVSKIERQGLSLIQALFEFMVDPSRGHGDRAEIGRLLSATGDSEAVDALLRLFFEQSERDDLYAKALTLEGLDDRRTVQPLIKALLEDHNPHRRHAAARVLGWINSPGRTAALALARCLADPLQPQAAREEAAESLAYVGGRDTIDPLISVLHDSDVRIRFWAVFGLGSSCLGDARAVQALESMLDDDQIPPGDWWSVGKEAFAMLGSMHPPVADYKRRLAAETQRILASVNVTAEDRRWAEGYYDAPYWRSTNGELKQLPPPAPHPA